MAPPRREGDRAEQDPSVWWEAVLAAFATLAGEIDPSRVRRIAVDGTSGTFLLIDDAGRPQGPGIMYNDARGGTAAKRIAAVAPGESGAHGATSALARLMTLRDGEPGARALRVMHQADWIAGALRKFGVSDENNALKTGYDPVARAWPVWMESLDVPRSLLPEVRQPGAILGPVSPEIAREIGLDPLAEIRVGTTDGIAAFLATGAATIGDAVTSLGTTLVKVLAEKRVFDVASEVIAIASASGGRPVARPTPAAPPCWPISAPSVSPL